MARVRKAPSPPEPEGGETALVPVERPALAARRTTAPRKQRAAPESAGPPVALSQLAYLGGIAGSVFAAIALWGYDAEDPSFFVTGSVVHNPAGRVGAAVADLMFQGAGYLAWGVVLLGVAFGLKLAGRTLGGVLAFVAASAALVATAAGLELALGGHPDPFRAGGLLGLAVATALRSQVGGAGASLAVGAVLVSAVTVLFRLDWQPWAAGVVRRVEQDGPRTLRRIGAAGVGVARASAHLGRAGAAVVWTRSALETEDEDEGAEENDEGQEEAEPPLAGAPSRSRDNNASRELPAITNDAPARRGPPSHRVPEIPAAILKSLPAAQQGVWSARPAPPPSNDLDSPTQVSARSLVEVEYEPTQTLGRAGNAVRDPGTAARSARATLPDLGRPPDARLRGGPAIAACLWKEPEPKPQPEPESELYRPMEIEELTDPEAVASARPATRPAERVPPRAPAPTPLDSDEDEDEVSISSPVSHRPAPASAQVSPPRPAPPADEGDDLDYPAPERHAPPPAADARPREIIPLPDDSPPPPSVKGRRARGAAVLPGNLQSGGVNDDGLAVREADAFQLPPLSLMDEHPAIVAGHDEGYLQDLARRVTAKLRTYSVDGKVVAIRPGPVITMFEYEPAPGVKLSRISSLSDDLAMALEALSVRIVAPIPGRGVVGIEIPNRQRQIVWARDVFGAGEFRSASYILPVILGKDTEGRPYVSDLAKMPHLLVGGTTGSGKSVGINVMLCSLLYTRTPEELRLILVDPKMLEFELYQDIPHLLHPVVTEPKLASAVLKWACKEMDDRYRLLARWQTRNIEGYNQKVTQELKAWTPERARVYAPRDWMEGDELPTPKKLPYIVVVIDELADLMMVASKDVEESIVRIAQKARAAGIHLIVATQRPSVDVITGLIKANMPSRLAYQVRSKTDGRTILDQNGAESLLGKGDLLFLPPGVSGLTRIHAPFLADEEVRRVAEFLKAQGPPEYGPPIEAEGDDGEAAESDDSEMDETYDLAVSIAIELGRISTSMIQRRLKIGYNRAARLMELMQREGVVGPADGVKPREVLVGRNA